MAEKRTVIRVLDAFHFDGMIYETSFSKKLVVWKQHCVLLIFKKILNGNTNDNNNNGDVCLTY